MKKGLAAVLVVLILPSTGFAQRAPGDAGSTKGVGRLASVFEVSQLRRSAALEFQHQGLNRVATPVRGNARRGHPVLIGAAVGAGAGYLINAAACRTGESVCSVPGNLLVAGIGAGIGALVGVLVSRR